MLLFIFIAIFKTACWIIGTGLVITIILVLRAVMTRNPPIEETRNDLDFPPAFHDMRVIN